MHKAPIRKPRQTHRTALRARASFLEKLAEGYSVTAAATAAGAARATVYDWRKADPAFAAEWDGAVERGSDVLEDEARRRAVDGAPEPVVSAGRLVLDPDGQPLMIKKYSDALLITLLKARRPDRFRERISQELTGKDGGAIAIAAKDRLASKFGDLFATHSRSQPVDACAEEAAEN